MKIEKKDLIKKIEQYNKDIKEARAAFFIAVLSMFFSALFIIASSSYHVELLGLAVLISGTALLAMTSLSASVKLNSIRLLHLHIKTFYDKDYKPEEYL